MKKVLIAALMMVITGGAYAADFGDLGANASDLKARFSAEGSAVPAVNKGYVAGNDPLAGVPSRPLEWVSLSGGKFTMGTDDSAVGFEDAKPAHEVTIKTFDMSKTDVTVEQYAECVVKGKCTKPATGDFCNWGVSDRQTHPVNCVGWNQANQYAKFKGARLPSESEWEYAATSGGKNQKYPWGNSAPTFSLNDMDIMYTAPTMPVCWKTAWNTAQGLCDMSFNVFQWVQDTYTDSYNGKPADGSAFEGAGSIRVVRGGSFFNDDSRSLRADSRNYVAHDYRGVNVGFRLARSGR